MKKNIKKTTKKSTIMLCTNNPKKDYYSFECSTLLLRVVVLLGIFLIVGGIYMYYGKQHEIIALQQDVDILQARYDALYQEKEINDKTIITLSEMVNAQVVEEATREQTLMEESVPTGFPINGTATIEDYTAMDITVFQVNQGIYIIAAGAGEVTKVGEDEEYGTIVEITHLAGYVSIYRTNESATVAEGNQVERGTILFVMDEVGSFAYQISHNDQLINPLDVMDISG